MAPPAKLIKKSATKRKGATQEKKRSPNWTPDENAALVNAVALYYDKLVGKFSNSVSVTIKHELWKKVVDSVNALGTDKKSVDAVKTKWTDLRSRTKAKASAQLAAVRKTGGGEAEVEMDMSQIEEELVMLTSMERTIVKLGGKQWLLGIDGGIDSQMKTSTPTTVVDGHAPTTSRALALIPAAAAQEDLDLSDLLRDADVDDVGDRPVPEPAPSVPKVPGSKKRVRREASEISMELLNVELDNNTQLKRIATSMEELVYLKKLKMGLESFPDN